MDTLFALAAGELPEADAAAVRAHVAACADCTRRLAVASGPAPGPRLSPTLASPREPPAARPLTAVGRYRVLRELGRGAMGVVWLAEDTLLGRQVALKAVGEAGPGGRLAQQVSSEARAVARLQHPNVVGLFDVVQQDGQVYLAMEYVEGGDLTGWLSTPRAAPQVLELFFQAAAGLAAAHEAGVVHRDFKPANVLVGADGRARVSDFGLAAMQGEHDAAAPGTLVGTPAFMAPEQLAGRRAGPAADQYAFCAALALALTGRLPHPATTLEELRAAVLRGPPVEWPGVAPAVAAVLRRGLAVDPAERYPSMRELAHALRRAAAAPRRRRAVAAVVGAALAAVAGLGLTLWPRDACRVDEARVARALPATAAPGMSPALRAALEGGVGAWREAWAAQCRESAEGRTSAAAWQRARGCLDAALEDLETVAEVARRAEPGKPVAVLLQYVASPGACASPRVPARTALPSEAAARAQVVSAHLALVDVAEAVAKGDAAAATGHAARAEEHAAASGHPQTQARALLVSARLQFNANLVDDAARSLQRAVALAQASGALREIAQASFQRAFRLCLDQHADCRPERERVGELAQTLQAPWLQAGALELRVLGEPVGPRTREQLAEAVARWRVLPGAEAELARAQRSLLWDLFDAQAYEEALALSLELLPEGRELVDLASCELANARARTLLALGRVDEAAQLLQQVLRVSTRLGLGNVRDDAAIDQAQLLLDAGRAEEGLALLPADSPNLLIQLRRLMSLVQLGDFAAAERLIAAFQFPPAARLVDGYSLGQVRAAELVIALERGELAALTKAAGWLSGEEWWSLEVAALTARGLEAEARAVLARQPATRWAAHADLAMREQRWADALALLERPPGPIAAVERVEHEVRLAWARAMARPEAAACRALAAQRARLERHRLALYAPDRARLDAALAAKCR
jgi:hypothetical protein